MTFAILDQMSYQLDHINFVPPPQNSAEKIGSAQYAKGKNPMQIILYDCLL